MRRLFIAVAVVIVLVTGIALWPAREDRGNSAFFHNTAYNFEALRVLNDVAAAGGDTGEALQAIQGVKSGDADGWYSAWTTAGDRTSQLAAHISNSHDKGNAQLRAHTYYRSAEFFLPPQDPRRSDVYKKSIDSFYEGLENLKIAHERMAVPYGDYHLNAVYYPGPDGADTKPLLVIVGGYDSTLEELYVGVGAAAYQHGYSLLTYEGPGQGSVLREQKLTMQPDWEKPNAAVLDSFLATHPKPKKLVLLGESLGGYLAPRAAAFDSRIDGVVAFDVWYDGYAVATRHVPSLVFWLHAHGHDNWLDLLAEKNRDPGARWATQNGQWVFGTRGVFSVLEAFRAYSLESVAPKIRQDVLLLAGGEDHFVPPAQMGTLQHALNGARSVTAITYDRASGGALHCQIGAPSLWQAALFDWMEAKFGSAAIVVN